MRIYQSETLSKPVCVLCSRPAKPALLWAWGSCICKRCFRVWARRAGYTEDQIGPQITKRVLDWSEVHGRRK